VYQQFIPDAAFEVIIAAVENEKLAAQQRRAG
jgi:hypothetical protein